MEKIRRYGLFFPLSFIVWMLGLILGLPLWGIIIAAIIIPAIIIYFIPKDPSELEEEEEEMSDQTPQTLQEPAGQPFWQKVTSYGIGIGMLLVIVLLLIVAILLVTGSADRSLNATDLQNMCSGDCQINGDALTLSSYATLTIPNNDFSKIEIYLTEKLTVGSVMDVSIGPHKAHIWVGGCQYSPNPDCYRGEWWYTASSPEIGETYSRGEIQYAEDSLLPFRITKNFPDSDTSLKANLGDNLLVASLRTKELTPLPAKGTLVITCSKCSIKEVKIYYALLNRLYNILIGWINFAK